MLIHQVHTQDLEVEYLDHTFLERKETQIRRSTERKCNTISSFLLYFYREKKKKGTRP